MKLFPDIKPLHTILLSRFNSFWEVVKGRRSVRRFKPDPVPEQHLMKIIDDGRLAPTSGNQQPWKFILVKSEKQIEKLKNECFSSVEKYFREGAKLEG